MSQPKLLKKVIILLDELNIPYMLTGSVVSSLQGEPRSTHDIDVVVAIQKSDIKKFRGVFPSSEYYLDETSILEAIEHQTMFNLIDVKNGDKVDFWILTKEPFDKMRFSRRINDTILGVKMQISSPEDTILAKLNWAKLCGGSEKQITDALRIYEVQSEKLDLTYLLKWIKILNIEEFWAQLLMNVDLSASN